MNQVQGVKETELFFRQWLRSPKSMGSILPSSKALARAITSAVAWERGQTIVELGAGTGAISQGLLEKGMPRDALMMIELDEQLYDYLRNRFPGVRVVHGDATKLSEIVAEQEIASVSTVVSGLPMVNMPIDFQRAIVSESMKSVRSGGSLLQYSYSPLCPIPVKKLGVKAELVRFVLRNVPPATVWRFRSLEPAAGS
jgi:phosphatidylethanolamine/phosphatidyl-N-methylethanolamine N-methyltransferase